MYGLPVIRRQSNGMTEDRTRSNQHLVVLDRRNGDVVKLEDVLWFSILLVHDCFHEVLSVAGLPMVITTCPRARPSVTYWMASATLASG